MIEATDFTEGLTRIGIATRQPADAATLAVYHDVIGPQTTVEEWLPFVQWALASGRWKWFPRTAELQDALREFRGGRPLLVEASDAYERVLAAGTYTPEGGTSWNYRGILKACGDAAAEAFLAAGGNSAFATTWDEAKRRERFVQAYAEAVREEPASALLPPGNEPKALPSGEAEPSREDATTVIRKLQDLAGVEPEKPKAPVVVATDERLEELKRQAEQIIAAGDPVERRA